MFKKQPNFKAAESKIPKSAFSQLSLLDPSERTEHKITRESSFDSDL
jgi:hypothetical protein